MSAELDLTAAIEAAHAAVSSTWHVAPGPCADCSCGQDAELAVEAALPHIREQLARQASHEPTQEQHETDMAATYQERWGQNSRVESERLLWEAGYRSGRDATARIVRGES